MMYTHVILSPELLFGIELLVWFTIGILYIFADVFPCWIHLTAPQKLDPHGCFSNVLSKVISAMYFFGRRLCVIFLVLQD